eukprot:11163267-Lingulodinium_polyedra.AAC.1
MPNASWASTAALTLREPKAALTLRAPTVLRSACATTYTPAGIAAIFQNHTPTLHGIHGIWCQRIALP